MQGFKILTVDDNLIEVEILSQILRKNNFKTIKVYSAKEALEVLEKEPIDLIISDILMPEINGYEFCEKVKKDEKLKEIPFILLTHLSNIKDIVKGLESGADSFIIKPYQQSFLISRINDLFLNKKPLIPSKQEEKLNLNIFFNKENYAFNSSASKIIQLLLSTYEYIAQKNEEFKKLNNELLSIQEELNSKNEELKKVNEQRNYFFSMASHDIRNPLTVIQGYTELLLEEQGPINEEQEDSIMKIRSSSEFMLSLVNNILDFSNFETGNLSFNFEETDIEALVKHTIEINRIIADKKNIRIKLNIANNLELTEIVIDSYKIQQVLNNLITNAIKFSYPDKDINITIDKLKDNILISIQDQGQGIPEDDFDKLFVPFQKTSVKATQGEKSTGLGLSIARRLVESHDGKIYFESEVGKGSTFYIELPLFKEQKN